MLRPTALLYACLSGLPLLPVQRGGYGRASWNKAGRNERGFRRGQGVIMHRLERLYMHAFGSHDVQHREALVRGPAGVTKGRAKDLLNSKACRSDRSWRWNLGCLATGVAVRCPPLGVTTCAC